MSSDYFESGEIKNKSFLNMKYPNRKEPIIWEMKNNT